ncbi:hypothetical protein R6Q59_036585 [Mikania micrantha]
MAIHLYKTSTPSTRNGTVDSQVKSNPRNNLIYGQHHCGKGRNARGIITAGHRGGGHKRLYRKIDFRRNEKDIYGRIVTFSLFHILGDFTWKRKCSILMDSGP